MQELRTLRNFHTLMAILSALNDAPVHRLKFTKEKLPVKFQKIWQELDS